MSAPAEAGQQAPLKRSTLAFYGLPALPISAAGVPIAVYLAPLYTSKEIGLNLALVGAIIMLSRIWDGVSDPMIGRLSDTIVTRFGRRKPWLLAGTPLTMIAVYYLFIPPDGASWLYFLVWIVLFYTGWTMVTLPFGAWGAEISPEYAERSRVAGAREAWSLVGTLVSVIVPGVAFFLGVTGIQNTMIVLAWAVIVLFPLCIIIPIMTVADRASSNRSNQDWKRGLRIIWHNGPFKRLLIAFAVQGMGRQFVAILFVLYTIHVIKAPDAPPLVLAGYFGAGIVGIPLWVKLSNLIGKHRAWLVSMFVFNIPLVCALPLGAGDIVPFTILATIAGLSVAAGTVLPLAMKADVIDIDTLRSTEQRTGLFFALWGIADKLSIAVAAFLALSILAAFGFDPKIDNGPNALLALSVCFLLLPSLFSIGAAILIWNYPITSERHRRIRDRLQRRRQKVQMGSMASGERSSL